MDVELLSIALVREYLSRKGYKFTLETFDEETSMKEYCINNRRILAEKLQMMQLVQRNKENGKRTFRTFIEMIVEYFKSSTLPHKKGSSNVNGKSKLHEENFSQSKHLIPVETKRNSSLRKENSHDRFPPLSSRTSITNTSMGQISSSMERSSTLKVEKKYNESFNGSNSIQGALTNTNNNKMIDRSKNTISKMPQNNIFNNLEMADLEDVDNEFIHSKNLKINETVSLANNKPITLDTAMSLKTLIFGSAIKDFNQEWKQQGFEFNKDLAYGLTQHKGGPCGLLACVQAYIIKHLFFTKDSQHISIIPDISRDRQSSSLVNALCDILNKVSTNERYIITLPTGKSKLTLTSKYKPDKLTETLLLYTIKNLEALKTFITNKLFQFEKQNGCILLLYSVILSRGVENIRNDMDNPCDTLFGRHSYCTQEMVNMLLTGAATANVNDGVVEFDTGGREKSILRGVEHQNEIGYLSLFEHYNSCQVGDNYKTPLYPIWVIMSESHFSIMFSLDYSGNEKKSFNIFYYDELARQDEDIKLTVSLTQTYTEDDGKDLISPLEHCIRTKWNGVSIDWNGTDPLL